MDERSDGGIKCSEIIDILDGFADGTLDTPTTKKINEHLKCCQNCANFGADYLAVLNLLKAQGKLVAN